MSRVTRTFAAACAVGAAVVLPMVPAAPVGAACDGATLTAAQLNAVFGAGDVAGPGEVKGYSGGDYQHVYDLPGGRKLWLFQDMFFSNDDDLRDTLTDAAHNAGLLQDGTCWSLVGGIGQNYLGQARSQPLTHWFWPMDGQMGRDGKLWVFAAEMYNPNGTGAEAGLRPVATWLARIDPSSLEVLSFTKAPDSGRRLYGWSVASDSRWTYLYGHCYRQFVDSGSTGPEQFDEKCSPHSYLARVPVGRFDAEPQYWDGARYTSNAASARPVLTRGAANPMSVRKVGSTWVNVTKIDDWWGGFIFVDAAPTPAGPWELKQYIFVADDRMCDQCGIFHAVQMRGLVGGRLLVSTSNGAPYEVWYDDASLYRPTFRSIDVPTYLAPVRLSDLRVIPRRPKQVLDTKDTGYPVTVGSARVVDVASIAAPGSIGVRLELTVLRPRQPVQVRTWACGSRPPAEPNVTAAPTSGTVTVTVRVGRSRDGSGTICVATSSKVHLRAKVTGSYIA